MSGIYDFLLKMQALSVFFRNFFYKSFFIAKEDFYFLKPILHLRRWCYEEGCCGFGG